MSTVSVTSKGQITIPLSLRKRLGLQHGSRVELVVVNDHLEMHLPVPPTAAGPLAGSGFGLLKSPMSAMPADFDAATLAAPGQSLVVAKTVLLEFEWVMRGYYQFSAAQVAQVVQHLMTLPHVLIEDRPAIETAIALMAADDNALDFADALHHASYRECEAMATFDDRRFARRAQRLGLVPRVIVPR